MTQSASHPGMTNTAATTKTVTFTHHIAKPEYKWEIVVPEGPTVLLPEQNLQPALDVLGLRGQQGLEAEIAELPNGGSRSVNAEMDGEGLADLVALGVKTV